MTNKEILERAIQKAIDGGWRGDMLDIKVERQDNGIVRVYWDDTEWSIWDLLLNKAFAMALWGEDTTNGFYSAEPSLVPAYQFHLMRMVISGDPIAYLGENI